MNSLDLKANVIFLCRIVGRGSWKKKKTVSTLILIKIYAIVIIQGLPQSSVSLSRMAIGKRKFYY